MRCTIRKKIQLPPTPENDWFLKKSVLLLLSMLIDTTYNVLLITVLLLLLFVGNKNLNKNNAIAIDHSLRAVNCLNQIMRI